MTVESVALTVEQAAIATSLSVRTLERAYVAGDLPVSRIGRRVLILRPDLERWVASHRANVRSLPTRRTA